MAVFSIIQKSQLEGAHRLDAEYYQPEYLLLNSKLKTQNSKFLKDISEIVYGTTPGGGIFEECGTPFVRSQNFFNLLVDTSDIVFCSEKFHKKNKKSEIRPGDILFAAVGATIGELAIVQDEIKNGNINQNIAAVRITDKNTNPYFVGLFFASNFGQMQIDKLITGNAQSYLNSEQIGSLMVPILDIKKQNEAENYFDEIQKKMENSKSLYSQAENLLLEELGLKNFSAEGESASGGEMDNGLARVVNFSDVQSANRMDAEYFQIKYEKLLKRIKEKNGKLLGEIVSVKKGIEPGAESYVEEGKKFIRVSNMSKFGISGNDQKYVSEDLYKKLKDDFEPKIGEILLTKDATPGIAFVLRENADGIIASGILRLKLKDKNIEDEYAALCLNSAVGKMQAERDAGGSVIAHWRPEQIKNVLIPVLPKPVQQKIAGLVRQSSEARKKSKELLEAAKQKVEEAIEKKW